MSDRAVVSGLGFVGAVGCGRQALARALEAGTPSVRPIEPLERLHRSGIPLFAASSGDADLSPWLDPRKARRMSPPSKYAVTAAKMALDDAGLDVSDLDDALGEEARQGEALGVVLATSFGPSSFTERLLDQIVLQGPEAASPFLFTESVANAPAAQVALTFGARGANLTLTQREAGPLLALARGAQEVRRGRLRCALVLAVDEVTPLLHGVLARYGALTSFDGGATPLPLDHRRDGYLLAGGAAVAVVEAESEVHRRGGRILARIGQAVRAFDPRARRTDWSRDPDFLSNALQRAWARTGRTPQDFDLIVSGAAGTISGDRLEAGILRKVWDGASHPPVLIPKAVTGEFGGGFLASAVLAAAGAPFGAPAVGSEPDPDLGISPHPGSPLPPPARLLATSLAPGGAAAWVELEAGDPQPHEG